MKFVALMILFALSLFAGCKREPPPFNNKIAPIQVDADGQCSVNSKALSREELQKWIELQVEEQTLLGMAQDSVVFPICADADALYSDVHYVERLISELEVKSSCSLEPAAADKVALDKVWEEFSALPVPPTLNEKTYRLLSGQRFSLDADGVLYQHGVVIEDALLEENAKKRLYLSLDGSEWLEGNREASGFDLTTFYLEIPAKSRYRHVKHIENIVKRYHCELRVYVRD